MTIKEVEDATGLTRANIRFYESKQLFSPERKENNYREYSDTDVEALKKIVLLRKMGVSIEDIQSMFHGHTDLLTVMEKTQTTLQEQLRELNGSLELCNYIYMQNETITTLNTQKYFAMLQEKERCGSAFKDILEDIIEDYQTDVLERFYGKRFGKELILILAFSCLVYFISGQFIFHHDNAWWQDLTAPIGILIFISVLYLFVRIIRIKSEKAANIISTVIRILCITGLILVAFLLLICILDSHGIHLFGIRVS